MRNRFLTLTFCLGALALAGCDQSPRPEAPAGGPPTGARAAAEPPKGPKLSQRGYQHILDFEVGGGKRYYDQKLRYPTWPGAQSGITVGVGYDLGYNSKEVILSDWEELGSPRERLAKMSGLKTQKAREALPSVKDIEVQWKISEGVFNRVTLTRFHTLTRNTFPGFDELHENAQAALVSLVFNRGSSMVGDSRLEMRKIRDCVARKDYAGMAYWNRKSVRIWEGTSVERGLSRRREAEAVLMETPF